MSNSAIHDNLSLWIAQNGGSIHKSVSLHTPGTADGSSTSESPGKTDCSHRGIFAKHSSIKKGEILIRLPETLALDGKDFPMQYGEKNASPWLRCLASLLHAWHSQDFKSNTNGKSINNSCYLDSLPEKYDSLLNWKSWELRFFLAGTALGTFAMSGIRRQDESTEDDALEENMHRRYQTTVAPYLTHLKEHGYFAFDERHCASNDSFDSSPAAKRQKVEHEVEHLYKFFVKACQCISTRAFHMQSSSENTGYQGPFLLPWIDLINHAPISSPKHVTTLQRDPKDGSFVMIAERDIEKGEEICHSYDSGALNSEAREGGPSKHSYLNSAQLLQTFGFVDVKSAIDRLSVFLGKDKSLSYDHSNMTPAILTKEDICKVCKTVSLSSHPSSVRKSMEESGMLDEGWECWELPYLEDGLGKPAHPGEKSASPRKKSLDALSDEIIITTETILTDEIITICSLNFLPDEAIEDLCDSTNEEQSSLLLTEEVLDDYFLGSLVLNSIINAVDEKLKQYRVGFSADETEHISNADRSIFLKLVKSISNSNGHSISWGEKEADDLNVLSKLADSLADQDNAIQRNLINKFVCGLTVSLEERACLLQLKKTAVNKLLQLNET